MKLRILNYGMAATHDLISPLSNLTEPMSISDFDAFIFDPAGLISENPSPLTLARRQQEVSDLINKKGGVVICIARPHTPPRLSPYYLLDAVGSQGFASLRNAVQEGMGTQIKVMQSARGASTAYFQVLKGSLIFTAFFATTEEHIRALGGTTFAVNSANYPIAIEFQIGEGRLCIVPPPNNITGERMGAAIVKVIKAHFEKSTEIDAPVWVATITVPRADVHDAVIEDMTEQMEKLGLDVRALKTDRDEMLKYRRLLFGTGKAILEPVVRSALRLLGFAVPESEEYEGEWDVELREAQTTRTAIGEVEGSEGFIDVDKYRQLLDYIEGESLEGREPKGILIGNGFRLLPLHAPERQNQFSDHARRGAARNGFCLVPTSELFKAVCAVLETPDEALKAAIRESLYTTIGPWGFVRETIGGDGPAFKKDQIPVNVPNEAISEPTSESR